MGVCASKEPASPHNPLSPPTAEMTQTTKKSLAPARLRGAVEGAHIISNQKLVKGTYGKAPALHIEYAARTRPTSKDQDCFYVVPHGSQAVTCGITDGHSVHDLTSGRQHAEAAAQHLGSDLWRRVGEEILSSSTAEVGSSGLYAPAPAPEASGANAAPSASLVASVTESFMSHQRICEERYEREVSSEILAKKLELEKEIGEELPLELPQEGGTTATAIVITTSGLLVAWVGDSRAVVAIEESDSAEGGGGEGRRLKAVALTTDHSTSDKGERERIERAGGQMGKEGTGMAGHVSVPQVEGSLKVTRSLGDSPFHKGDAVTAQPGVMQLALTAGVRFAVVASDGIWDHLDDELVVATVADAIRRARPEDASRGGAAGRESATGGGSIPAPPSLAKQRSNGPVAVAAAAAACDAVLDRIDRGQASGELGGHQDDRSICVLIFGAQGGASG